MEIWKICEKLFLSEKNPTSIFKMWVFFRRKKKFSDFLKNLSDEAQEI